MHRTQQLITSIAKFTHFMFTNQAKTLVHDFLNASSWRYYVPKRLAETYESVVTI